MWAKVVCPPKEISVTVRPAAKHLPHCLPPDPPMQGVSCTQPSSMSFWLEPAIISALASRQSFLSQQSTLAAGAASIAAARRTAGQSNPAKNITDAIFLKDIK